MLSIISTVFSALLLHSAECQSGGLPNPVIGAYFSNFAQYRPAPATYTPQQMSPIINTINTIFYGFAYFCPNLSMAQPYWLHLCQGKKPFDVINVEPHDPKFYRTMVGYKSQNPELRVIISIGGRHFPSNFFSQMVSDISSRTAFINSAKSLIQQYRFDGIDLNWEYPKYAASFFTKKMFNCAHYKILCLYVQLSESY